MNAPQLPLELTPPRRPGFDNFVVGTNQSVIELLRTALCPDQWYFLAGPEHSGRSHLAQAVLNSKLDDGTAARFVGCRDDEAIALLDATAGDWVIVDDVDVLAGNAEGEVALFNALNRWRADHAGVLLTGVSRSGFDLPDLASRLNQAAKLILRPMQGATEEAFVQLIRQLLEDFQLTAGHGLTEYLLRHAPRSPPRLVELFEQFSNQARAERRVVSIPLARRYLAE